MFFIFMFSIFCFWIPACAGMTEGGAGMTEGSAGMTEGSTKMTCGHKTTRSCKNDTELQKRHGAAKTAWSCKNGMELQK